MGPSVSSLSRRGNSRSPQWRGAVSQFLWGVGQTLWGGLRGALEPLLKMRGVPAGARSPCRLLSCKLSLFRINHFSWLNTSPTFCGSHCAKLHGEPALQITLIIRSYTATFILIKLGRISLALILKHWQNARCLMSIHKLPHTDGVICPFKLPDIQDYFTLKNCLLTLLCHFILSPAPPPFFCAVIRMDITR